MPNLGTKSIACDTCHLLKFTRLLFMPSLFRANKIFKLVHYDFWGPIIESFNSYKYLLLSLMIFLIRKAMGYPF